MSGNPKLRSALSLPTAIQPVHYVYILTNRSRAVLYIGVTNDLEERLRQHRERINPNSFASRYNLNRLVYFERFDDIRDAIAREKELKGWKRKNELITESNPRWSDLALSKLGFDKAANEPFRKIRQFRGKSEPPEKGEILRSAQDDNGCGNPEPNRS